MKNFQNKTKIIKASKVIRAVLFAGLALEIIGLLVFLADFLIPMILLPKQNQHASGTYAMGYLFVLTLFAFVVNLRLFRFFDRLKNGHLFDVQTVGHLDAAGKWCLALRFYDGLFSEVGNEFFQMKMTWDSGGLFMGLMLVFVAWLLKEAQGLQEEQELTV